jgi:hypothetical protein
VHTFCEDFLRMNLLELLILLTGRGALLVSSSFFYPEIPKLHSIISNVFAEFRIK